ncbi:MAG: thiamine pyrophosphate-dependent enzyme [Alphaproteobacteria bacterium]
MTNGGHILVKSLASHGVTRVFTVAGESYLPALDGLLEYPKIDVITCRQESGVTFMADAHAALTGQPGIAFVTRGPGACNASIGIHTAKQSSTPLILFVGLISTNDRDKEAFQEFDLPQMFGSLAKWATVIERVERIPEYVARAYHVAMSGRPGPVVLGLPEDILFPEVTKPIPENLFRPIKVLKPRTSPHDMGTILNLLENAQKPVIIAGDGGWDDRACADLQVFAENNNLPVICAFRRQDTFPNAHKNYIGDLEMGTNPALIKHVQEADVILAIGTRLCETTTQSYTLFQEAQTFIHVYPAVEEFGKAYPSSLAVETDTASFLHMLAKGNLKNKARWSNERDEARKNYEEWTEVPAKGPVWDGADMTQVFGIIRDSLPQNAIVTTDAGNFAGWARRYIRYGRPGRSLSPVSGAMGYGVPSAVAASLQHPDRLVIGVCGDGGFMMTSQELATAAHHGATPVIIVCNNRMYGTIRMYQERDYPGRHSATFLTNPDFIKLAQSYGAHAVRIERTEDFAPAWKEIMDNRRLTLVEIVMDRRQIATRSTL